VLLKYISVPLKKFYAVRRGVLLCAARRFAPCGAALRPQPEALLPAVWPLLSPGLPKGRQGL